MKVLFDGDVLVYMAGFASEERSYDVINIKTKEHINVETRKKALNMQKKLTSKTDIELVQTGKGEDIARMCIHSIVTSTLNAVETNESIVVLSPENGKDNFRFKFNKKYKANRKNSLHPVYKKYIRQYLIDTYDTIISKNEEADDTLGVNQTSNTVIASIDKDLWMIPGRHINLRTKDMFEAKDPGKLFLEGEASRRKIKGSGIKWFLAQMLLGDKIDNIEGVRGYGPVKTFTKLNKLSLKEGWKHIEKEYTRIKQQQRLLDTARQLWIRRVENEIFEPKKYIK